MSGRRPLHFACGRVAFLAAPVGAAWRDAVWTARTWREAHPEPASPLMALPGVTALTVKADYLHCMYLGALQYFLGSVLQLLCFVVMPEDSAEKNLKGIIIRFRRFWDKNPGMPRYSHLKKSSFVSKKEKSPQLKGRAVLLII